MFTLWVAPLWLLVCQVNARSAMALKAKHLADNWDGVSSDEEVAQLGADIGDLMSNIGDPAAAPQQDAAAAPQQSEQKVEAEGEGIPPVNVIDHAKVDLPDLLADGTSAVAHGAMEQAKKKLSGQEKTNAGLRQQLRKDESIQSDLQDQLDRLKKQVKAVVSQKSHSGDAASNHLAQLQISLVKERKRAEWSTKQFQSLKQQHELLKKTMKEVGDQADSAGLKAEELRLKINTTAKENEHLRASLRGIAAPAKNIKLSLLANKARVTHGQDMAKMKLQKLEAAQEVLHEKVDSAEKRNSVLLKRDAEIEGPMQPLLQENQHMKKQLGAEVHFEKQLLQMFNERGNYSNLQLRRDTGGVSKTVVELHKARFRLQRLRKEAERQVAMSREIQMAEQEAELKAERMQVAFVNLAAENKELKERVVPLLGAQIKEQSTQANRAAQLLQEAAQDRDSLTAVLSGAQSNVEQAQRQYATVLRSVVATRSSHVATGGQVREVPFMGQYIEDRSQARPQVSLLTQYNQVSRQDNQDQYAAGIDMLSGSTNRANLQKLQDQYAVNHMFKVATMEASKQQQLLQQQPPAAAVHRPSANLGSMVAEMQKSQQEPILAGLEQVMPDAPDDILLS